eukprot:1014432-Amphidinium_carterae.1
MTTDGIHALPRGSSGHTRKAFPYNGSTLQNRLNQDNRQTWIAVLAYWRSLYQINSERIQLEAVGIRHKKGKVPQNSSQN